jgi:CheY-like chemotaxis protein
MTNRILLVDDDAIFRSEFKECFEEFGTVEASNGEEALRILKKPHELELVILDVPISGSLSQPVTAPKTWRSRR